MQNDEDIRETADDTEAHAYRSGRGPAETPQDIDAHGIRVKGRNDAEAAEGEERLAVPDADDDVEAHRRRFK